MQVLKAEPSEASTDCVPTSISIGSNAVAEPPISSEAVKGQAEFVHGGRGDTRWRDGGWFGIVGVLHSQRSRVFGKESTELSLELVKGSGEESAIQVGRGVLEPGELLGEVGHEAGIGEAVLPDILDDVGEPLLSEAAVVGEELERLLEAGDDGEVPREVLGGGGGGEAGSRVRRRGPSGAAAEDGDPAAQVGGRARGG